MRLLSDKDYHFRRRAGRQYPTHEFIGGPRLRCFYPEFLAAGVVAWSLPKLLRSVRYKIGILSENWGILPPMLIKMPLIRGGSGHWVTSHRTTPMNLADVTGVLLHYKFFSDFHDRVATALAERQHYDLSSISPGTKRCCNRTLSELLPKVVCRNAVLATSFNGVSSTRPASIRSLSAGSA